jgi:predicted TIM-barrel fold metal-dependent hydrolase
MNIQNVSPAETQLEIRADWLGQVEEEIIEPDLPVIDAHHHLWDPPGRRYLFDEFLADLNTGHRVTATIFAPCRAMYRAHGPEEFKCVGETEFIAGVAARSDSGLYGSTRICAAIVGSVDFALGDRVAPVLEAHIQAGGGRFRGIRGRTSWHEDPTIHKLPTPKDVLTDPATFAAIRQIGKLGLLLDLWVFHTQLDDAIALARSFPDLPIIVNHVGGPLGIGSYRTRRDEVFVYWMQRIETLASLPNITMKVGGLAMRYTGFDFHERARPPASDELVEAWQPYVDTCIQAFGPDRCMFESNFPVDKAMCSYPVLWNAFKKLAVQYTSGEKTALMSGTAARVYKI